MESKGARQVTEWWGPHAEREAGRAVGERSWMGRVEKKWPRRYFLIFFYFKPQFEFNSCGEFVLEF
jgi:hypothetical protein